MGGEKERLVTTICACVYLSGYYYATLRRVINLMGWVSVVTQTWWLLTACRVPSMAGASSICGLFPDVVAADRA